ncbi:MAG: futalosine hydrolase [Bacteroidota bacterium]
MKILVVSATEAEIAPLLQAIGIKNYVGDHLRICKRGRLDVDVLITGVGMTATAFRMGKALQGKYDLAFNFGLAGSFNPDIPPGGLVNIVQDHFSELGAEDGDAFLPLDRMGLGGAGEVMNTTEISNKVLELIPKVCGITVNTVHGREESIKKVEARLHPNVESMEGAAFLYCCMQEKLPCAQVRAVSNLVERRNREKWNIPLAVANLNEKALELLDVF